MSIFFSFLKGFFFFLTIVVGIIFVRGQVMFDPETFTFVKQIIMPAYLVFCGLILGYLISVIWIGKESYVDFQNKDKIYIKSFIIGILLGVGMALAYIFM